MPLPSSTPAASQHARSRKVKLMISHAGKILPRPSDNKLRYVGGETRMISIPRLTRYSGFVQKMLDLYGSNLVLRYQLPDEELDALVTVSCDEDLENMLEECDRLEASDGSQKLRVFVFSSSELDVDQTKIADPETSQQLYVNAVNAMSMDTPSRKQDNPGLSLSNPLSSSSGFDADAWPVTYQMQDILKDQQSGALPTTAGNVSLLDDLTPDYVSDPVPLVSSEQNKEALLQFDLFSNQSTTASHVHDAPFSKEDFNGLISGAVPANSLEQEVHQQDSHFRWDSNPQMQKQEGLLPFSTAQDSRTDVLSYIQSSDMVNGLESAEKLNWWDEHFSSEPGALLQKELQTDEHILDILSDGFMVNQSSQQPPLEGWYTQQQTFHKHGDLESQQHLAMPAFYNPWSFLAQKNTPFEHTKSTQRTLSTELPASNELQLLPELSFTSVSKGNSGSFGAPNGNIETLEKRDLLSQQEKVHQAYNVPLPDLETTKASDKHRGERGSDVPLLIPDPVSVETSDSVFQTCYGTFSSLQADTGEQVVALKGLKSIPTFKDTQKQRRFDGEYPVEGLWSETQLSCASSRPDVNSDHLQEESTKASECYFDDHPTIAHSTVTTELTILEFEGLSLLEDSICAKTQDKHAADKIIGHKLDPSSSAMDYISTLDMVPNLLRPSRLTHSLPVDNSNMDHLGGDLNAEDGAEPLVMSSVLEPSIGRYDISGSMTFDAVQNSTNFEAIFSQSRHHESALAHVKASIAIENQGNLDTDELYSAPASSLSAWEASLTEAEHWKHTQMQHITQERGPMLEKAVKFEDTKHEPEDSDGFESISDQSVSAVVNAEEEAKARGLQIIRNIDLEELRELGSGTFGTVYHGKWRGTDVAIKRIKASCFTGRQSERERLIADFWREACILGQLHHPNVVAFYGVVPDGPGGTLATVAEYMVNGSLKQVLAKKDRTLDRRKRLLIAMDAAFGMEYLHSKNVVHFDLKCENLLVNLRDTQRPICKVADLGLSKVKKKTMVSGGVRGTLPWMAPELLNGSSSFVSEKIDVFSFGIVMWELLTGEEPYANMHYGAIIGGIVNNTLRPPVPRWCDGEWKLLMERCWSADPSERPTFSQIARSLRAMEASLTARGYVPIAGV